VSGTARAFDLPVWCGTPVRTPAPGLRRVLYVVLVGVLTAWGVSTMYEVLSANGMQPLQTAVLALFAATFAWISAAFCSAVIGAALNALGLDPLSLRRTFERAPDDAPLVVRTAVVMPVYNENVARVIAGLEATYRDLESTGAGPAFDFHLLSDTTDEVIAAREARAVAALRRRTAGGAAGLYYRRRRRNSGRKAGNIAEFCRRWGAAYECMVILDADSVMTGATLCRLVRAMQANPNAGIIQTVPLPIRQRSLFGRGLQFAATLYSPMLATGLCFWQMDAANYWGHNAIIRLAPFMRHCELPVLPGSPPLGGEILSHDFVEAALMRRAGWSVLLMPEIGGSFEEVPGNVLDYVGRDRRWCEGNLQHLRLLTMPSLHPLNRLHFLLGAFAYGCSFLWLLMLALSSVDAAMLALGTTQYFGSTPALFPDWPIARSAEMWQLLSAVLAMLFLPKLLGLAVCVRDRARRRAFGGCPRLLASGFIEMLLSVVFAPVMMCYHAWFVVAVLRGQRVRWEPPCREGRPISWGTALRCSGLISVAGLVWGSLIYLITPTFFWALTPVLLGLVLAAPLMVISSGTDVGRWFADRGVFQTPPETRPEPVLAALDEALRYPSSPSG
jgi:membrane glycosyltransferase